MASTRQPTLGDWLLWIALASTFANNAILRERRFEYVAFLMALTRSAIERSALDQYGRWLWLLTLFALTECSVGLLYQTVYYLSWYKHLIVRWFVPLLVSFPLAKCDYLFMYVSGDHFYENSVCNLENYDLQKVN